MKVIPKIKRKKLASNEARVIIISEAAIEELLLEHLLERKSDYFDVEEVCDDDTCAMCWDSREGVLTYAVMPIKYCFDGYKLNFDNVFKTIGITTDSLYKPNRYRSITLTEEMLEPSKKTERKTGDGSMC